MPVLKVDNYMEAYRLRAQSEDTHDLAGRPNNKSLTEFVNRQILEMMQIGPDDVLVDIGCGDACLLRMAKQRAASCIGISVTTEEKIRLENEFPDLRFIASAAQSLPLNSSCASKIVCNATLMYLPSLNDIQAALREIVRIAQPGATIWIGEMPELDEFAQYGMYRGTSVPAFLWHLLRHNGLRAVAGIVRRLGKAMAGTERIVLNSAGMVYLRPEEMVQLAEGCALRLRTYFRHREPGAGGEVVDSRFRYDYIFTV